MDDKRIVIAYDGSPDSEKALNLAITLAKAMYADLFLVAVVERLYFAEYTDTSIEVAYAAIKGKQELSVEKGAKYAREAGVLASGTVIEGNPPYAIIEYANEQNAFLIVVGTRGLGGFQRLLLGSTARELVTYSNIPVLVAK